MVEPPLGTFALTMLLDSWAIQVGVAIDRKDIIQAGNSNSAPPTWGASELISNQNSTGKAYVGVYAHHNYPGGSIQSLMTHSKISNNLKPLKADAAAALAIGKPYVLGETNSGRYIRLVSPISASPVCWLTNNVVVSGGGAANVSPTFGAALWTMDYAVRAAYNNISRTYFHHGTVGNCKYCFFGRNSMGAPYYGAYTAVAFLAGAKYLTALDDGTTKYAAYASFDPNGLPLRVLLFNSEYHTVGEPRPSQLFTLTGLNAQAVKSKRLTAPSALSRQDQGDNLSFGGQYFNNRSCTIGGTESYETTSVSDGEASFALRASEALLIYLQ